MFFLGGFVRRNVLGESRMQLFWNALLVGYSGAMMPGPLLTYTIERSLRRGWKVGLLVSLGHILLEMIVVSLLYLGLGTLLNETVPKIVILFAGGAALLWFGFDMIRSAIRGTAVTASAQVTKEGRAASLSILAKAGVISVLNPYFLLWWATIGLGFMLANPDMGIWGVALFYSGHALADISWYMVVSLLCDRIGRFIGGRVYRVIIALLGGALGFFAVKFIIDGLALAGML